jgi:type IV pilus assembly protein PilB
MARIRLGEQLLQAGLITERQLSHALQAQQATGSQLGALLLRLGYVAEADLVRILCEDADIPFSTLTGRRPEPAALAAVPDTLARDRSVVPLAVKDDRILVAAADPFNVATIQTLEAETGMRVSYIGVPRERVLELLDEAYAGGAAGAGNARQAEASPAAQPAAAEISSIVRFDRQSPPDSSAVLPLERSDPTALAERGEVAGNASQIADEIFQRAVNAGATDIHIEPMEDRIGVRYRIDGILREGPTYPKSLQAGLITRVKVISGLNIAETRLPQDGRLRITVEGREVDLRISSFPTLYGEDLVLRVLDQSRIALDVARLGMSPADAQLFRESVARPHGMILITGPTGSGKTTTLYAALSEINNGTRSILTLEDPIEYELRGVRQSQINVRAGLTFASGLRALLRHDPDVILVGEMRDQDTMQIGMSAAMTGHMVLSTLHTNTAAGAIPRLLDMGAEPFVIASTLQLCVAQRLIRTICRACQVLDPVPEAIRERYGLAEATLYRGRGCAACSQTGYRGRVGIYEILPITEEVAAGIYERRAADEIQGVAQRPSLFQDGLQKVRAGMTTLEELLRAVAA